MKCGGFPPVFLKINRISCREVYTKPEDGFVWRVYFENKLNIAKAEQLYPNLIDESDLPDENFFIEFNQDSLMPVIKDSIIEAAQKERRDILDISLEVKNGHIREVSCEMLGEKLTNTQQLFYSLAYKNDSIKGQIPRIIRDKNSLYVAGTFAASFGIRFKSYDLCNLLGETDLSNTIYEFSRCIFRPHPDTDSGNIRTTFRNYPDSISAHPDTLSS